MSRELRVVPPFDLPTGLLEALETSVLHFGDVDCASGGRVVVEDRDSFYRPNVSISWARDHRGFLRCLDQGLKEISLQPTDTTLLVQVQTRYLGLTQEALHRSLRDLQALEPTTDLANCEALRAGNRGVRIRAYLLLNRNVEPQPFRPWRKGTWLARAEFNVDTDWLGALFRPTPLDAQQRKELGLPNSVLRYMYLGDHDPLASPDADTEQPIFYVDEDLLARLDAWSGSPMARATQLQLVQDFVTAIVHHGSRALRQREEIPAWEDAKESLLGRMLLVAAGKRVDPAALLEEVREEPTLVLARFEHEIKLRKEYIDSVGEGGK